MRAKDLPVTTGGATSDKVMKINSSGTLENITVANLATLMNVATSSYTKYVALLTQSGTSAPTATVLENTTGLTINWTRASAGTYSGTRTSGSFSTTKTAIFIGGGWASFGDGIGAGTTGNSVIDVRTSSLGAAGDDILSGTVIEIRIYP